MAASGEISHVSDTALMVAACRALETDDSDSFMHDPFAARLAGERGMAIFRSLPFPEMMRFGIAVRTRFLDDLLLEVLAASGIPTVLSVGCGLDTRPWRLDVPPDLRWVEVDFADMLDYKEAVLAGEKPRCRRERLVADLNDPAQRRAVYDAAVPGPALMITEGLLMYLSGATVDAMAAEAAASPVAQWIADINTSAFSAALNRDPNRDPMATLRHVQAPDWIPGEGILDVLQRHGWTTAARRSYITDMAFAMPRIQRMIANRPGPPQPPPPIPPDDPTGVHRFTRHQ